MRQKRSWHELNRRSPDASLRYRVSSSLREGKIPSIFCMGYDIACSAVGHPPRESSEQDWIDYGLLMWLRLFAPLDAGLLVQRYQIEIHPPAVSTSSQKIEGRIVLQMS
jgi:hypothetical protein